MATAAKSKPVAKKANTGKTVAGVKIAKKKPTVRRAHLADEKYTGTEPQWDTERALAMSDEDFDHHLRRSFYYYNYHFTVKDLKSEFVKWLQDQKLFAISKTDLSKVIKSRWVPMTACSLIAAHNRGMPLRGKIPLSLETMVRDVCEKYDYYNEEDDQPVVAEETRTTYKQPTIQDRLNEKTAATIGELEGHYDDLEPIKFYEFLVAQNVPQGQLGKIEKVYAERRAELELAQSRTDEQVSEGYKHLKAADFKRIYAWLDDLQKAIDQYRGVKKATKKARVKKSPSKEKLVAKLKYAKQDTALKLVSVNPVDVIGAQELWVYNVKTRKLGQYMSATSAGLGIKGTSIENYTAKSVQKTLRKPEQQLAEFMKAGKVQLRKFMDSVKTTEIALNGRVNEDTLLLRVA
jgi:molecular chaperone GrpE (heat shock protein)